MAEGQSLLYLLSGGASRFDRRPGHGRRKLLEACIPWGWWKASGPGVHTQDPCYEVNDSTQSSRR